MRKINILIADDQQIIIDGLKSLLAEKDDIQVVGEAVDGEAVLDFIKNQPVDIVILDIEMPKLSGIEVTKIIKRDFSKVKVLILSMYNNEKFVHNVIEIGADGYILKNKGKEELALAIKYIAEGDEYFGREVEKTFRLSQKKKNLESQNVQLTKREIDVLKLIAIGDTTPIISEKLFIAHSTVETHRRNLIEKTNVRNSKGLVKYAIDNGYL
ncbi:response regulator transcription factor [Winogradskyella sp.]|jgi:DNA-binding NarL/FixJ family response regulator|uniref:response regulator transcription factor n=1 Tax=Winogradskyella sp. TaxID=1883156 RepID=UPI0025F8BF1F|nr:response regulator transcription factor [Winogradskyella sp.]MCT4628813.1 response regulator transcription factor [Winogradskyella sp.]